MKCVGGAGIEVGIDALSVAASVGEDRAMPLGQRRRRTDRMVKGLFLIALDCRSERFAGQIADKPIPIFRRFIAVVCFAPALHLMIRLATDAGDKILCLRFVGAESSEDKRALQIIGKLRINDAAPLCVSPKQILRGHVFAGKRHLAAWRSRIFVGLELAVYQMLANFMRLVMRWSLGQPPLQSCSPAAVAVCGKARKAQAARGRSLRQP